MTLAQPLRDMSQDGRSYTLTKDDFLNILRESPRFQDITKTEKILDWQVQLYLPMGSMAKDGLTSVLVVQTIRKKYKTPKDAIEDRLNKHEM